MASSLGVHTTFLLLCTSSGSREVRIAGDRCPCQSLPGGGEPYCGAHLFNFGVCWKITGAQTRALQVQALLLHRLCSMSLMLPGPGWKQATALTAALDLTSAFICLCWWSDFFEVCCCHGNLFELDVLDSKIFCKGIMEIESHTKHVIWETQVQNM